MKHVASRRMVMAGLLVGSAAIAQGADAQPARWLPGRKPPANPPAPPPAEADHMAHMHHGAEPDFALSETESAAVRALSTCASAGDVCLSHCLQVLSQGDVSMAACARAVRDMLSVCRASQTLISTHSALAGQQLVICRAACDACRDACTPHASHHQTCRACAEACVAAIAAIDVLLA